MLCTECVWKLRSVCTVLSVSGSHIVCALCCGCLEAEVVHSNWKRSIVPKLSSVLLVYRTRGSSRSLRMEKAENRMYS